MSRFNAPARLPFDEFHAEEAMLGHLLPFITSEPPERRRLVAVAEGVA